MAGPIKVYIGAPLNGSGMVANNLRTVLAVASILRKKGYLPFIPHLYFFWDLMFPMPEEYWLELDREWLLDCHVFLRLEGVSPGADKETIWANDADIPIVLSIEELDKCRSLRSL
jgi:hypothetical protein